MSKMSNMKVFALLILSIALLVWATMGQALTFGAGKEGRGYDRWATDVTHAFNSRGVESDKVNLKGSDDLTLGICAGEIDVAPSQQDAAYQRQIEGCELQELWTYPSEEFMFLAVPPDSKIDELEDLKETDVVITDAAGSGSDFTARQIRRIEMSDKGNKSPWAKFQLHNKSVKSAVGLGSAGKIAGVFFVGSINSEEIKFFLKNGWSFVEVYDKNLDDLKFNGKPLYEGQRVKLPGFGKVYTYKVKTSIYGKELGEQEQEIFESVMSTR